MEQRAVIDDKPLVDFVHLHADLRRPVVGRRHPLQSAAVQVSWLVRRHGCERIDVCSVLVAEAAAVTHGLEVA